MADVDAELSGNIRQSWLTGGIIDMTIRTYEPIAGWEVTVDVGGDIINIWNATVIARSGSVYRLGAAEYNADVPAGETITFGLQTEGGIAFEPRVFNVTRASQEAGEAEVAPPVAVPPPDGQTELAQVAVPSPGPAPSRLQLPEIPTGQPMSGPLTELIARDSRLVQTDPGTSLGGLFVGATTQREPAGDGAGLPGDDFAPGPFSTRGATIIDSAGNPAVIHGINWFGLETDISTVHGLWARNWRAIMDDMKDLGFNLLRMPISGELVRENGGTPSGIDFALNPDLEGLNGLQILDAIVAYAERIGMRILLDYHRGPAGDGPNDNGLWYGQGFTEADVIDTWRVLAERYGDSPAVIGADLVNAPHGGTWGDGSATDWAAAAERIGSAVQSFAPQWLIVVEGIGEYDGDPYWWGGNLQGVRDRPIELPIPNKLVYSPHDYPASVFNQPWFNDGTDLTEKFRENWGFIAEEGIAPVLIGEWGSRLEDPQDIEWAVTLSDYLADLDIAWIWWSLNPNSGDTGGIFADDWQTLRRPALDLMGPALARTEPIIPFSEVSDAGGATFTVSLPAPAAEKTVLKYATTDGTAFAGDDYVATSGSLTFQPGETRKTVTVPLLPDAEADGDEFFYLVVGGPGGRKASNTAAIIDDDRRSSTQPFVDVASTVSTDNGARFRVLLTEPAQRDLTITFVVTPDDGSSAPVNSSLTIPAGDRDAFVDLALNEDSEGGQQRFTLELTGADGAIIRNGRAAAVVGANEGDATAAAAEIEMGGSTGATDNTQLTIDLIMEDDWGSGALYNIIITNTSNAPVESWQMAIDLPFEIVELWSAVLVDDVGERVTMGNADWNGTIEPGETAEFGFISSEGGVPLATVLAGADLELAVQ